MQEASLFKLKSLQQQLSESVSCAEMDRANEQLNQQAIKYQLLLSQQTMYTASTASVERLQVGYLASHDQLRQIPDIIFFLNVFVCLFVCLLLFLFFFGGGMRATNTLAFLLQFCSIPNSNILLIVNTILHSISSNEKVT